MPKFESSAARALPKKEKPKLTLIEGGKAKAKSVERWSPSEVLKPNAPKPRAHGAEAPVNVAEIMRSEAGPQPKVERSNIVLPKPGTEGTPGERWSAEDVLKPNMPRPRAHGAEAPVSVAEIMRSEAGPQPKKERPSIVLPKPRGLEEPIELGEEAIEEVLEEAPPPTKLPKRRPPPLPPSYREAA